MIKLTEFHKIIKECRNKLNLSQAQISKNLGIKKPTYCAIESNKRPVPKYVYNELDKHYNFKQFELRESLLDYLQEQIEELTDYQLLCLTWKLQNLENEE